MISSFGRDRRSRNFWAGVTGAFSSVNSGMADAVDATVLSLFRALVQQLQIQTPRENHEVAGV
jgi:hypothetical protein